MTLRRSFRALLAALALVWAGPAAHALESAPATTPHATAMLVSDADAVAPGGAVHLGLRLRMAPGWHIYWKNPGDAGVPPQLDWTLPAGVTAGPIAWPAPTRNAEPPLMTYGYAGEVLLPVTVSGAGAGPLSVGLHASWLICEKLCVPEEADLRLTLPAGPPAPSAQAPLFAAAAAAVPRPSPWPATIAPDGTLHVAAPDAAAAVRAAWFIPDSYGTVQGVAEQPLSAGPDGFALALRTGTAFKPDVPLSGVLVVRDRQGQETALELRAAPGGAPAASRADLPLWRVLGLAALGGLILNLMPCVFPVLAMKAAGLARLSGAERGHARMHALSYTAGVVLTFGAVGLALLAARAAAAGWGFQFQSPLFVAGMAWLLFAVGLNLSGVFTLGEGLAGAGEGLAGRGGHAGSFFTGMLAVLVATPCTAPFMGAAIAAALAATPAVTLAVFVAMGLGLAAPFLVLAGVPALARALPRPGAWMDVLKQALAFPMYAACVWLVWVISQQSGPAGVLAIGAGLLLVGFAAWAFGLSQRGSGSRVAGAAALGALLLALAILSGLATAAPSAPQQVAEAGVEPFSAARLAALRQAGTPVFVNMTAAWCVTCLVNERVALSPEPVRQAFAAHGVAYLKGDWTRQDPAITAFLRANGRDGVPLYLLYPPGGGAPQVLPQILTPGGVLAALAAMGGKT